MGGTYGNLVARLLVSGILKMNWVLDHKPLVHQKTVLQLSGSIA